MRPEPLGHLRTPAEVVSGFMATLAIFASAISVVWHPLRLVIVSMVFALVSAAMGPRNTRLSAVAVAFTGLGFFFGMIVAVAASRPLW